MVRHVWVPTQQGKERTLIEGKKEIGKLIINRVHGFSSAESLPGKKRSFSSSCWTLLLLQSVSAPHSGLPILFNWSFCSFFFPFSSRSLSESITDQKSGFLVSSAFFVPQCQERPFLGVVSHVGEKVHRLETCWGHIQVTRRDRRENSQALFI